MDQKVCFDLVFITQDRLLGVCLVCCFLLVFGWLVLVGGGCFVLLVHFGFGFGLCFSRETFSV